MKLKMGIEDQKEIIKIVIDNLTSLFKEKDIILKYDSLIGKYIHTCVPTTTIYYSKANGSFGRMSNIEGFKAYSNISPEQAIHILIINAIFIYQPEYFLKANIKYLTEKGISISN